MYNIPLNRVCFAWYCQRSHLDEKEIQAVSFSVFSGFNHFFEYCINVSLFLGCLVYKNRGVYKPEKNGVVQESALLESKDFVPSL